MRSPALHLVEYVAGVSPWCGGPAWLARLSSAWLAETERREVARGLVDRIEGVAESRIYRRRRDLEAAVAATSDLLVEAVSELRLTARSDVLDADGGDPLLALACPRRDVGPPLAAALDALMAVPAQGPLAVAPILERLHARWEESAVIWTLFAAGHRRRIPMTWLSGDSGLLLGQGARAHVSQRGLHHPRSALATDKVVTAELLARAGVPTTGPRPVADADHAAALFRELDGPVVLKPRLSSAQMGVWTHLSSEAAVRHAFERVVAQGGPDAGGVLLEPHHPGRSVRATLVGGRLRAVAAGSAITVEGDGQRTVIELAHEAFALEEDDRINVHAQHVLEAVLATQGSRLDDVPPRGRRLRTTFETASPHDDLTDALHPSLRRMLAQIGRIFPLPVLGVDLLIEDWTAPLDRAGCVVVEVNEDPAFTVHDVVRDGQRRRDLSHDIVRHLFPRGAESARIPVIAGPAERGPQLLRIARELRQRGTWPAGYTRGVTWSGSPASPLGHGGRSLVLALLEQRAQALVVAVDEPLARCGIPLDRADFLLTGGSPLVERTLRRLARRSTRRCGRWQEVVAVLSGTSAGGAPRRRSRR